MAGAEKNPEAVRRLTLAQMFDLYFGPEAEAERKIASGQDQPPAAGDVERSLFWQTYRRRGLADDQIEAAWQRHLKLKAARSVARPSSSGAEAVASEQWRKMGRTG